MNRAHGDREYNTWGYLCIWMEHLLLFNLEKAKVTSLSSAVTALTFQGCVPERRVGKIPERRWNSGTSWEPDMLVCFLIDSVCITARIQAHSFFNPGWVSVCYSGPDLKFLLLRAQAIISFLALEFKCFSASSHHELRIKTSACSLSEGKMTKVMKVMKVTVHTNVYWT